MLLLRVAAQASLHSLMCRRFKFHSATVGLCCQAGVLLNGTSIHSTQWNRKLQACLIEIDQGLSNRSVVQPGLKIRIGGGKSIKEE